MNKGAILSEDKKYRYQLWRVWNSQLPKIAIVGLNPSTADDKLDDPTIIRCIEFAKSWGYGGFYMVNLFAFRATNPNELNDQTDPIGQDNDKHLIEIFSRVEKVICAWGNGGIFKERNKEVLKLIEKPYCLQKNANGEPSHPLYLKKSLIPVLLSEADNNLATNSDLINEKNEENVFTRNSSKHIFTVSRPERGKIKYNHRLKHFDENDIIELTIRITDGQVIFNQSDELIISQSKVYWYISRVGELYTKSNDELDAEHIGEEFIINIADIKTWKAVFIDNICYLEMQTKENELYQSVHLPTDEQGNLLNLQKELNRLAKANN